jgi:hypothetical protein
MTSLLAGDWPRGVVGQQVQTGQTWDTVEKIDPMQITLARNRRETVRVRVEPWPSEERIAVWALVHPRAGELKVRTDDKVIRVLRSDDLPRPPFKIVSLRATSRIGDEDLDNLCDLSEVEDIGLQYTGIPNAGFARLAGFPGLAHLKRLSLRNCSRLTGDGLESLKKFRELSALALSDRELITGTGVKHLRAVPRLTELDLSESSIHNEDLAHLRELTELTGLNLFRTTVTDAGLVHLCGMKRLSYLNLNRTRVTDAGLGLLEELRELKLLVLPVDGVTKAGAEKLAEALPGCRIVRDYVTIGPKK